MCKARQHSDQMICGPCALQWDMNDPDPPVCALDVRSRTDDEMITIGGRGTGKTATVAKHLKAKAKFEGVY